MIKESFQEILDSLPTIKLLNTNLMEGSVTYIGAAGFEDRALSVLNEAVKCKVRLDQVVAIEYRPSDERNKKQDFQNKINEIGIPTTKQHWLIYDRCAPESFALPSNILKATSRILVDISGMSKFLIAVILQELSSVDSLVEIVYAEAETYHPSREKFEEIKNSPTEESPVFLTSDVYKIVTTSSLSSMSMPGYPSIMVAFSTFNYQELMALLNEVTSERLIVLEGKPHDDSDDWRLDAIKWINRKIDDYISIDRIVLSTFDYIETLKTFENIYEEYGDTHKLIVAPTGSKLQSVGVFLFKQIHPDTQLVYPVTKRFSDEYTLGHKALWSISFPSFSKFLDDLGQYRKRSLMELKRKIDLLDVD